MSKTYLAVLTAADDWVRAIFRDGILSPSQAAAWKQLVRAREAAIALAYDRRQQRRGENPMKEDEPTERIDTMAIADKHPGTEVRKATYFQDAQYDYSLDDAEEMVNRINVPNPLGVQGPSEIAILRDVCRTLIRALRERDDGSAVG